MGDKEKEVVVVCFSDIFWDFVWQRHQSLLTRFPEEWNILFVEPTSLLTLITQPRRFLARRTRNITIISLPTLPLMDKVSFLRFINDHLVSLWLRMIFRQKGIKKPVLLYYAPRFSSLIGRLGERLVAYDYADDRMAFSGVPAWIEPYVEALLRKSDIVFVTSETLRKKALAYRKDGVYLVGNGVDAELFKKARDDLPLPDDIKDLKKPIIGYFGVIDDWLDVDLVAEVADAYLDASIVLIGPVLIGADGQSRLKSRPNIFLLGKKPHDELPGYLRAFDVCIIPFKINELTKSVNPVKLYEYMAGGKNVISTTMLELEKYGDVIFLSRDNREFVGKIAAALSKKPDMARFGVLVSENTWDMKAKDMVHIIENS